MNQGQKTAIKNSTTNESVCAHADLHSTNDENSGSTVAGNEVSDAFQLIQQDTDPLVGPITKIEQFTNNIRNEADALKKYRK